MNKELSKPKIMYFGLYNLPGIFQKIINSTFQKLLHKGILVSYMDNFIIPAKTKKELEKRIVQFLKVTKKYNICFKWSKCNFDADKISILGVVVGQGEVQMKDEKFKVVKE